MNTMLVLTLSGSVLALLLVGLRYTVLRKMPSTVYYYAWLLVLLRFALPLPGFVPTTGEKAEVTPAPSVYVEMNDQETTRQVSEFRHREVTKNVTKSAPVESSAQINLDATETQEMTVSETAPKASLSIDWKSPKLWISIWALGAIVSLGFTVFSYIKFNLNLKKNYMEPDSFTKSVYASIPGRKPALYFSDSARTPMMLGLFNPKIVLPYREYNEELLLNILRHELTHYRRFDALYKWVTVAILSVHWFNPIAWFVRRELNRACEMSCDEMLLRSMNKDEKQSYGNSLLLMAASSALPTAVVATSFATEKRNLKERLVQIMSYKKSSTRVLAAVLAVTLLTGCGVVAGPISAKANEAQADAQVETQGESQGETKSETQAATPKTEGGVVKVKNVDEFLAAIAPNTVIELAEGVFDLSKASDYAKESKNQYYSWNLENGDDEKSAELIIKDVEGLTIRGAGIGKTTIEAVPRYANVIRFNKCKKLTISNLTAGHTKGRGECTGGVLLMESCTESNVEACGLYGCGTIGVQAANCKKINITNSDIYECSYGAVTAYGGDNVIVSGCDIHDIGPDAIDLFSADSCDYFIVHNCKIHDNFAAGLLNANYSENAFFISNDVTKNTFNEGTFCFGEFSVTVDGCHFDRNYLANGWYKKDAHIKAVDLKGKELDSAQFKEMKLSDITIETVIKKTTPTPAMKAKDVKPGTEVSVKTIDEFLEAIGPDRTIVLDGTNFDLSKAKNYGGKSTAYYRWEDKNDGPELVIHDVKNLTMKAKNPDASATTLEALPRYANVLVFKNCENVTVAGFTAGHTKGKGTCSGGVIYFNECSKLKVEKMRLYGCGDMGIDTFMCSDIDVIGTEIYECTSGACDFYETSGINLKDCNIHDVPSPALRFTGCEKITWNGQKLEGKELRYDVKADSTLVVWNDTPAFDPAEPEKAKHDAA